LSSAQAAPLATILTPRLVLIGGGSTAEIANVLRRVGIERPLIVTDPFMAKSELLARLTGPLGAAGIPFEIFSETVPDPTTDVVEAGTKLLKSNGFDGLIGFGGGSPMDTAKAMAILHAAGGRMRDWKVPNSADIKALPIVCVPTTAGTGSEVTKFTVITDTETDEKMLIMGLAALPTASIVDYELTLAKPFRLSADTGVDALTHAIEAYVSRRANKMSDMYALSAMKLIHANLRTACFEPQNAQAREAMMLGATQAGLAFSNASVALVHGMSRPIGAHFHVPHGLSNAMLLPTITAFSVEAAPERYADCARAMEVAGPDDGDDVATTKLLDALRLLNADLKVPGPKDYGIDESRWFGLLPTMADQALASGSPGNNPRVPSADEIVALYRQVWAPNQ
jgi:alcohol dehydrogenase class IV